MRWFCGAVFLLLAMPAAASEGGDSEKLRPLCSERPGLTTAACTVDPGHVQIELGLTNWMLDKQASGREDRIEAGDLLARLGVGDNAEIQLGWLAYGAVRTRDPDSPLPEFARGTGDLTLGFKRNFRHPAEGGTGLAFALLPYVTLPTGSTGVGDGDWSAGLVVPLSYKLDDRISFALSPEVSAAVNDSGSGRHLSYGLAIAVQIHLTETVRLSPELQTIRDEDPAQPGTRHVASLSFDAQLQETTQVDIQIVSGLNQQAPDVTLTFGVTHKF